MTVCAMLDAQRVEELLEIRFAIVRSGDVSQIDEQVDGAIVARGLFRGVRAVELEITMSGLAIRC